LLPEWGREFAVTEGGAGAAGVVEVGDVLFLGFDLVAVQLPGGLAGRAEGGAGLFPAVTGFARR